MQRAKRRGRRLLWDAEDGIASALQAKPRFVRGAPSLHGFERRQIGFRRPHRIVLDLTVEPRDELARWASPDISLKIAFESN